MSRSLAILRGARGCSTGPASKVLKALGVTVTEKDVGSVTAADGDVFLAGPLSKKEVECLGRKLGVSLDSTITSVGFSSGLNPDQTYADAKFTVVKSNLADPCDVVTSYKDRVDKFARAGVPVPAEVEHVKALAAKTAQRAATLAAQEGATKVTLVQKPQSALSQINSIYLDAVKTAAAATTSKAAPQGLSVEVATSAQAVNKAVMFSKTLGVVVAPDYADAFEQVAVGIGGGVGMMAQVHSGDGKSVHAQAFAEESAMDASANPTGVLVAAAAALRSMDANSEADKLEAALKKVYGSAASLTADVQGGKAGADAFADAVAKAI